MTNDETDSLRNDFKNSMDDCITPSPTFDFPPFVDCCLDTTKPDDDTSLISLDVQCDYSSNDNDQMDKTSDKFIDNSHGFTSNLPSPLTPASIIGEDYHGFTLQGSTIPTIPCNTGDLAHNTTDHDTDNYSNYFQNI